MITVEDPKTWTWLEKETEKIRKKERTRKKVIHCP